MSAIETERGVGQCPDRPNGFGHVWAGTVPETGGDSTNPCRFCKTSGREFFAQATSSRLKAFQALHAPMESGTGKSERVKHTPEQDALVAEIIADKKRRDAEAVASGTARTGQIAGAPKGKRP